MLRVGNHFLSFVLGAVCTAVAGALILQALKTTPLPMADRNRAFRADWFGGTDGGVQVLFFAMEERTSLRLSYLGSSAVDWAWCDGIVASDGKGFAFADGIEAFEGDTFLMKDGTRRLISQVDCNR
jgi:hypothetical protein